jgi:hypothetical protein
MLMIVPISFVQLHIHLFTTDVEYDLFRMRAKVLAEGVIYMVFRHINVMSITSFSRHFKM